VRRVKQTNADKLRSMTNDELAAMLEQMWFGKFEEVKKWLNEEYEEYKAPVK
jgi:hypothetical protein